MSEHRKPEQGVKLRGAEKVARIPVKVVPTVEVPRKPDWIRVKMTAPEEVQRIKTTLRAQNSIPFVKKQLVLTFQNALAVVQQHS
ncbi:hypothetical protein BANRA_02637 [Acinetobacter baumannii]|nr:hypothetical protein BANRA_02637 [Acinetobacter baumannii]